MSFTVDQVHRCNTKQRRVIVHYINLVVKLLQKCTKNVMEPLGAGIYKKALTTLPLSCGRSTKVGDVITVKVEHGNKKQRKLTVAEFVPGNVSSGIVERAV